MKHRSLGLLISAEVGALAVWFSSAAVLADLQAEFEFSVHYAALLSSTVQAGFAVGAVPYAVFGLADRFDPRRVFAVSALLAAALNLTMLLLTPGSTAFLFGRFFTGAFLAGVYPVGMKLAVGWGVRDRGLLVGLLVGALTLGSAAPHLLAAMGGADWRWTIMFTSALAAVAALLVMGVGLGPHHGKAAVFAVRDLSLAWRDRKLRLAFAGYLGHMWELYAFWAWIGVALTIALGDGSGALEKARLITFTAIATGAVACVLAGVVADRIGKANVTIIAMTGSGAMALAAAAAFNVSTLWLTVVVVLWGATVIADSAQFSALVADVAPPRAVGSLLTLQTALGFGLTVFTVQLTPVLADRLGWPGVFVVLALGPLAGTLSMLRFKAH
ncbi:MAG: MFS transporter [Pseudomonadota bacterium]